MKICVVKTSSMGDVIHTLPALTDAQQAIPHLQVDWVVEKPFAEIPRWHSAVNRVIAVEIRRWRKQLCRAETWQAWRQYKQQLQAVRYDAIIDAQGLLKSALLVTRLARGTRYGYDRFSAREGLSALCYDRCFSISYQQHAVERIRQLFAASLGYALPSGVGDYGIANTFAQPTACLPNTILAIHSTTRADKHWAEERWAALFQRLAAEGKQILLPWGNGLEQARAVRLAQSCSQVTVLPKCTLGELAQTISQVEAVVSVDTGLSHLTAALNKPNVILYGATDPRLIGAYGQHQHYLQADTMAAISVEQVFEQLLDIQAREK